MTHFMNEDKPSYSRLRKGLLVGALTISTLAAVYFGIGYHKSNRALDETKQQLSNAQQQIQIYEREKKDSLDYKLRGMYQGVKDKADEIIPEVKKDYKRILIYAGSGLLLGLGIAYVVRRRKKKNKK